MNRWILILLPVQIVVTWSVLTLHLSSIEPPNGEKNLASVANLHLESHGKWYDRKQFGIHQLILRGSAFERGWASGRLTHRLMEREEAELFSQFRRIFPSIWMRLGLQLFLTRWFSGIDEYIWSEHLEEMHGVSLSSPAQYDIYLPAYTRQIVYHGIHEVGQMIVDKRGDAFACTVLAVPAKKGWVIGRTFDFEGGRIFDEEKVMKWVYPREGLAYLSIIWAGMVGVVTGVNEKGVYISINAAGTADFRRQGTVTTLLVAEALQRFSTAREAAEFLQASTAFVSDIFVLADRTSAFRVEKSPRAAVIFPFENATVVANHFKAPRWENDKINRFRKLELTSAFREKRGEQLLQTMRPNANGVLKGLRDKTDVDGTPLELGNRRSIDSLIATHGVIYNSSQSKIYISQGPSLSGGWQGFDLNRSFATGTIVVAERLPSDPRVPSHIYERVKAAERRLLHIKERVRKGHCDVDLSSVSWRKSSLYSHVAGDLAECRGEHQVAKAFWQMALDRRPAYVREMKELKEKLGRSDVKNLQFQ